MSAPGTGPVPSGPATAAAEATPAAPRPPGHRPATGWATGHRRPEWRDIACVGGLVFGLTWYLALIPFIPPLIGTHPVLLEALNGSLTSMIAAGSFARIGRAPLALALVAPVTGLGAFDPFWWWAGRRYGAGLLDWLQRMDPRTGRRLQRSLAFFRRWGGGTLVLAYYLPVPNNMLYATAGWAGMSFLRFILLDLAGTLLNAAVMVGLGYALGGHAAAVARLLSHYSLATTVALVTGILLVRWVWRRLARDPR